jgi:hypothetical protein
MSDVGRNSKRILGISILCLIIGSAASLGFGYFFYYNPRVTSLQYEINLANDKIEKLNTNYTKLNTEYTTLSSTYNALNTNYTKLNTEYTKLSSTYNTLSLNYHNLQIENNNLNSQVDTLTSSYNQIKTSYDEEKSLRIGTTLETYYDYVRAHYAPSYEDNWVQYPNYYSLSVGFAANEAGHDADQLYWPSLEKQTRYFNITNEHAPASGFRIVSSALTYAGVNSYDSNITKIDKILKYIHTIVVYQTRLLDHMWFPSETLTFRSGDCTSYSILAASMFEASGIKSAVAFFKNTKGEYHAMVLVYLQNLGGYGYSYYSDLTSYSLKTGRWIIIEPQFSSVSSYSSDLAWVSQWNIVAASEVPYGP